MPELYPGAASYRQISMANGRTQIRVECAGCQHVNYFALWSFAGNGSCRCKGCGLRILYRTLQTVPNGELDRERIGS